MATTIKPSIQPTAMKHTTQTSKLDLPATTDQHPSLDLELKAPKSSHKTHGRMAKTTKHLGKRTRTQNATPTNSKETPPRVGYGVEDYCP